MSQLKLHAYDVFDDPDSSLMRTGTKVVLDTLARHGVKTIFAVEGHETTALGASALEDDRLRLVTLSHPGAAVHAARAWSRVTGQLSVVISPGGAQAAHLIPAIVDAQLDSAPVIIIGAHTVPDDLEAAARECDMMGLTNPVAKHNLRPMRVTDIERQINRAVTVAATGRPGPVYIDLTFEVQHDATAAHYDGPHDVSAHIALRAVDMHAVERAWMLLRSSDRPLIVVGQGAVVSDAGAAVLALAELARIPIATTLMAKGVVDEGHPLCIGCLGATTHDAAAAGAREADTVLAIGCRFATQSVGDVDDFAAGKRFIRVDIDPFEVESGVTSNVALVCDARDAAEALFDCARDDDGTRWTEWSTHVCGLRARDRARDERESTGAFDAVRSVDDLTDHSLRWTDVLNVLNEAMRDEDALVLGGSGDRALASAHVQRARPRRLITSGAGHRGFGLPAAIGAAAALKDGRVWALEPARQASATLEELGSLAASDELSVAWLVVDDGSRPCPDFANLALAYGVAAYRSETMLTLVAVLRALRDCPGAAVVHVRVQPEDR